MFTCCMGYSYIKRVYYKGILQKEDQAEESVSDHINYIYSWSGLKAESI